VTDAPTPQDDAESNTSGHADPAPNKPAIEASAIPADELERVSGGIGVP